jgi:Carboxypeptidase regulatory-like domain/TonB dependent receptor
MRRFLCTVTALSVIVIIPVLYAQGPVGTLNGTITDPAGAVVPGATVVATHNSTGVESKTTSTSSGNYTLPYLPAGTYTIRVNAPGFQTSTAENVLLRVAQVMTIDIKLQVGRMNQEVVVSATPELLESDSAEIGQYITTEEYKDWPITVDDGQRQLQTFIFSSLPGTTGDSFAGSINGGQQYSHEILIEGIPIGRSDLSGGSNNEFSPSAEAVGEFKLQSGAISAQYNGGQTAVANFEIKSGTNNLHGSGFYYLGNEDFNSIPVQDKTFGKTNPENRLNNWGYSVGGPVYIPKVYDGRNKTFFFTNFEKTNTVNLPSNGFITLPTVAQKNGDFSCLLNPACTGNDQSGSVIGTDALGRPIVYGQLYDPHSTTQAPDGTYVRNPFPGNMIPQSAWDPVAKNIVQNVGITNPQFDKLFNNYQKLGTGQPYFRLHTVGVKIDHQINSRNQISGYYNQSYRFRNNSSCGGGVHGPYLPIPGLPTTCMKEQTTPGNMGRLSVTSTLTPSVVNRFAAGINRFVNDNDIPIHTVPGGGWDAELGLHGLAPAPAFPVIRFSGNNYQGGTIDQFGVGGESYAPNGSYIFQDDVTWIHGKHTVRFGYDYRRYFYATRYENSPGTFNFSPLQTALPGYSTETGDAFASFLLGGANSANQNIVGYTYGFRQPEHGLYLTDDWKITPRLTMNIGLRWEIIPPVYEVTSRMSEVSLSVPDPNAGYRPGALIFGGGFNTTYWKEFGPRFGIAYRVTDHMVVRAGYAMTNTPPIANNFGYDAFTFGYSATVNLPAMGNPHDPAFYLSQPFPSLSTPLPNTDLSSAEGNQVFTTARDANRPGYVQNYNFTIQYELPGQTVLEVAYVGNKGTRLWGGGEGYGGFTELDALPSSMLARGDILNDSVSDHPQYIPYANFDTGNTVSQALLPYPQYFGVEEVFPYNTNSNYNSFQVTVTRHLTKGLGFLAAYTWSKAIGYVDQNGPATYYAAAQDYYNRGLERSVTSFNLPQNFKLTWVWDTPFGKGRRWDLGRWLNPVLGGWQLSAIHNYQSGMPVAVSESGLNIPPGFAFGIRPDVITGVPLTVGSASQKVDVQEPTQWLNPAAFALSPQTSAGTPLRVGTAPRFFPTLRGPATLSEDFRIAKRFTIHKEGQYFEIGAVMLNALKRTHATINDNTVGDEGFGTLLQGGGNRVLQLSARIQF